MAHEIRLDRVLGRKLLGGNNKPVGRIEEFRTKRRGSGEVVVEVVIGMTGLLERLDLTAKMLFGIQKKGRVARFDQIDFSEPTIPKLKVPIDELSSE